MRKSTPILLSVTALLLVSVACAVPNLPAPTQDVNFLGTAIMSTMVSAATQTAAAGVPVGIPDTQTPWPTFTPAATLTPEPPTLTPSATLSLTPVFTSTSTVPLISVSVATNCRTGPGKIYDRVGALLVGEVAEVIGRNANGNYWYIRNPRQSNGFCWLWGEYATVTGNFAALPVFTPPPTPTPVPNFSARYAGLESCPNNNTWWVDIKLTNSGGLPFQSVSITVRDTTQKVVVTMQSDIFRNLDKCSEKATHDVLQAGGSRIVSAAAFAHNPITHNLRATITLCSREGQNGTCITKTIRFRVEGAD